MPRSFAVMRRSSGWEVRDGDEKGFSLAVCSFHVPAYMQTFSRTHTLTQQTDTWYPNLLRMIIGITDDIVIHLF
jgi:hypothetical protein